MRDHAQRPNPDIASLIRATVGIGSVRGLGRASIEPSPKRRGHSMFGACLQRMMLADMRLRGACHFLPALLVGKRRAERPWRARRARALKGCSARRRAADDDARSSDNSSGARCRRAALPNAGRNPSHIRQASMPAMPPTTDGRTPPAANVRSQCRWRSLPRATRAAPASRRCEPCC